MKKVGKNLGQFSFVMVLGLVTSLQAAAEGYTKHGSWGKRSGSNKGAANAPAVDRPKYIEAGGEDASCKKLPLSLRQLFYSRFERASAGKTQAQKQAMVSRYAKLLGMTASESNGNAACTTDMSGNGANSSVKAFFNDNPESKGGTVKSGFLRISLATRKKLLNASSVKMTKQSNFGLAQQSADRLNFDGGPALYASYKSFIQKDIRAAFVACGTKYMYKGSDAELMNELRDAAACKEGTVGDGIKCFGKLVTICPALNIDFGLRAPSAYWEKPGVSPRCTAAFNNLAKK